ncbi:DUF5998 family protein [Lipingzhangella sp. LS1_29]|uniref:DUF5998 family protein n=1 Tax=Lipingzhangella rawalii TaxID=2055835 RepID=A0ABU2H7Q5_9ACTN|nr:DUF5998 family protein [Lipingzhangella rawalii]MDS1270845.1 DUF5998 family protein [Lipingzhangella rawalii]
MRKTRAAATDWRADVERSGYYPVLVADAVATALGDETVDASVVHHEATFDPGMEVRRHITVLLLTPTRLIVCHTDEHPATEETGRPHASTSTEGVRLANVHSVAVTRVVPDPAAYTPGAPATEVVLSIGLGSSVGGTTQIDLEPAVCSDESCEADHGYTGTISNSALTLRVSQAADGANAVQNLLDFAAALSRVAG